MDVIRHPADLDGNSVPFANDSTNVTVKIILPSDIDQWLSVLGAVDDVIEAVIPTWEGMQQSAGSGQLGIGNSMVKCWTTGAFEDASNLACRRPQGHSPSSWSC